METVRLSDYSSYDKTREEYKIASQIQESNT